MLFKTIAAAVLMSVSLVQAASMPAAGADAGGPQRLDKRAPPTAAQQRAAARAAAASAAAARKAAAAQAKAAAAAAKAAAARAAAQAKAAQAAARAAARTGRTTPAVVAPAAPVTPAAPAVVAQTGGVITNCQTANTFALTFDGPVAYGDSIANQLTARGARGTFFLNGNNYGCESIAAGIYDRADSLKARYAQGHLLASHTWSHANVASLSAAQLDQEITLVETAFAKILGIRPKYFRAPYGSTSPASIAQIQARGYRIIGWTDDSGDSTGGSAQSSINLYNSIIASGRGSNMLNHETYATTANVVLPAVLPSLVAKGYRLITIAECLGDSSPYTIVGSPQPRDSSWRC